MVRKWVVSIKSECVSGCACMHVYRVQLRDLCLDGCVSLLISGMQLLERWHSVVVRKWSEIDDCIGQLG